MAMKRKELKRDEYGRRFHRRAVGIVSSGGRSALQGSTCTVYVCARLPKPRDLYNANTLLKGGQVGLIADFYGHLTRAFAVSGDYDEETMSQLPHLTHIVARFSAKVFLAVAFLSWAGSAALGAGECKIPREHHNWGRFERGAWKSVRVATETFDAAGLPTNLSVTDTRSTLEEADEKTFTLRIESTVEVAGKRITAAPQTVVQRYDGGPADDQNTPNVAGSERVLVDGTPFNCDVLQLETTAPMSRTLTKTFYCNTKLPYVLRRESTTTNTQTNVITGRSTLEAVALEMPSKVLQETLATSHFKATQQHEKGTSVTMLVTSFDVPGGVISHAAKELDADGRLVRRSTLELLDFGSAARVEVEGHAPRRPRLFRRHRLREGAAPANRDE